MKEKIWLWCHPTGAHDGRWNLPASSATPGEALGYFGLENAVYVVFNNLPQPPFAPHVGDLNEARRLVWSIVGDTSSDRNDGGSDLEPVLELARDCPNLTGAITDDFFLPQPGAEGSRRGFRSTSSPAAATLSEAASRSSSCGRWSTT